jgi:hypothetical protein
MSRLLARLSDQLGKDTDVNFYDTFPHGGRYRFIRSYKKVENYLNSYKGMIAEINKLVDKGWTLERDDFIIHTEQDLDDVLDMIGFKNSVFESFKWSFKHEQIQNGWKVWAEFVRPETHTNVLGIGRGRDEIIENGFTETRVFFVCWTLINLLVDHELREGIRYMDKRALYPHNSIHSLIAATKSPE